MKSRRRDVLKAAGYAMAGAVATQFRVGSAGAVQPSVIYRDVCVIGGGSAGTYTAIRLRDLGKSVVVLERKARLGGHAETFVDPVTNVPINIGVIYFENTELVRNYLTRLQVSAVPPSSSSTNPIYVDFRTGQVVNGYAPPSQQQLGQALFAYQQLLSQNFPYLDNGFDLPNPVPDDLILPFRNFVQKYQLQVLVRRIFDFGQGIGELLDTPTLYVLKLFSLNLVNAILTSGRINGGLLTIPAGVSQLYDNATKILGDDVMFNANVRRVDRSGSSIQVRVDSPNGQYIIQCRKLVVACPPTPRNLASFDLDKLEATAFSQLRPKSYATGVVKLSGLPAGISLVNTAPDTEFNLPHLPGIYSLSRATPDLWNVKYGSPKPLPGQTIRNDIEKSIQRLARAGTFPVQFEGFQVFSNHTPFQMTVSAEDIAHGFYDRFRFLQGRYNTFFNGAAFQTNDSSLIWRYTETLLPRIVG